MDDRSEDREPGVDVLGTLAAQGPMMDLDALNRTLSRLHRVTGVPVAVCDPGGAVLLSIGVDNVCSLYHEMVSLTRGRSVQTGPCECGNGLNHFRRDIMVEDVHIATVHLYGIRRNDDDASLPMEDNIDIAGHMRKVRDLPRLDEHEIEDIQDLIEDIVGMAFTSNGVPRSARSEEPMLQLAIRGARMGYWERNLSDDTFKVDQRWADMLGLTPAEGEGGHRSFFERVHPEDIADLKARLESHYQGDTPFYAAEFRMRHRDGDFVWVNGMGMVVERDRDGRPLRMIGINQDISSRKDAEETVISSLEEKTTLLQEVHHRVKNNLALINSMLGMQILSNHNEDIRIALRDAEARIMSMALVHEALYRTADLSLIRAQTHFENLVNTIIHGFSSGIDIDTEVCADDILLELDTAIPCSLVVNELLTNSLKYAFKGRSSGRISIILQRTEGCITLRYQDDGQGMPKDFDINSVKTLGMRLVTTIVHHQLRGIMSVEQGSAPTWIVRFPNKCSCQD